MRRTRSSGSLQLERGEEEEEEEEEMPAGEEGGEEEEEEEDDGGEGDGPDPPRGYAPSACPKVHQFCVGLLHRGRGAPETVVGWPSGRRALAARRPRPPHRPGPPIGGG